jgi:hypothetical protein
MGAGKSYRIPRAIAQRLEEGVLDARRVPPV